MKRLFPFLTACAIFLGLGSPVIRAEDHAHHGSGTQVPEQGQFYICHIPGDAYHSEQPGVCPYCKMELMEKDLTLGAVAEMGQNLATKFTSYVTKEDWADINVEWSRLAGLAHLLQTLDFPTGEEKTTLIAVLHEPTEQLRIASLQKNPQNVQLALNRIRKAFDDITQVERTTVTSASAKGEDSHHESGPTAASNGTAHADSEGENQSESGHAAHDGSYAESNATSHADYGSESPPESERDDYHGSHTEAHARSDQKVAVWAAPAGVDRGRIFGVVNLEYAASQGERDVLYPAGINCIASFPDTGINIWGPEDTPEPGLGHRPGQRPPRDDVHREVHCRVRQVRGVRAANAPDVAAIGAADQPVPEGHQRQRGPVRLQNPV